MRGRRVVASGRIKVDARRAVAKLREHLLLDPDAWTLEVVRVAAMCGASGVSVEHDADDLRISFDGTAPPAESVARLLDFALESSRDPRVRALRLLAIALNAALSTRPRRVTVAVRDDGGDARFSFDTTLHERAVDGPDARERELHRTAIERPALRGASVVVEMNKGFSWGTFVRFASQRPLREVTLLHGATRRLALPITFAPELRVERPPPPIMIVSLEEHGVPGGVLEVRRDTARAPRVELLEHGVVLSDVALAGSPGLAVEGHGVALPIDVHVDAEAWSTNASRSQVHAREVARVVDAVRLLLPELGRELGAIALGEPVSLKGVLTRPTAADAGRAAGAFACCAAASDDRGVLAPMLDLPLVHDAVGRVMPVRRLVALARRAMESAGAERVFVHRGEVPLPEAFGPFAADVVWLAGSPTDALLAGVHTRDFADLHRDVARGIARRDAWLREPTTGPRLEKRPTELLRAAIAHDAGELRGLRGEVAVHVGAREAPCVRVFVEERLLATVPIGGTLPLEAAIAWPDRLRPTLSFDGVVDDADLRAAVAEVGRVAAATLTKHAGVLGAPDAAPHVRALGRAALAADAGSRDSALADAALWPTAAGGWVSLRAIVAESETSVVAPGRATRAGKTTSVLGGPSGRAPSVGSSGSGRQIVAASRGAPRSTSVGASDAVGGAAAAPGAGNARHDAAGGETTSVVGSAPVAIPFVQHAPRESGSRVAGPRTVLRLDAVDADRLVAALARPIVLVPFGPAFGRVDDAHHRPVAEALERICAQALAAEGSERALVVAFRDGPVRGLVATSAHGRVIRTFAGVALEESPLDSGIGAIVILEDERTLPTPTWDGVLCGAPPPVDAAVQRLADAIRSVTRGADAEIRSGFTSLSDHGIQPLEGAAPGDWARAALIACGGLANRKDKLARTLGDVPFLEVLDDEGLPTREAPSAVRRTHPGPSVPYVVDAPGFPTRGWRPVVSRSRSDVAAIERVLGCSLLEATRECERRLQVFELDEARRRLLARPELPLEGPIPGAAAASPTGTGATAGKNAMRALVALRRDPDGDRSGAPGALRFRGRHVSDVHLAGVPSQLVTIVDTSAAGHIEKWARLSNLGREAATAAALDAARDLATVILRRSADLPLEGSPLGLPGAIELVATLLPGSPPLLAFLRDATVLLESPFGSRVPMRDAWGDGPTPMARRTFPTETAGRVLQLPLLLEPRHQALEKLLQVSGLALHDVTRALMEVTGGQVAVPARLSGAPPDARLRARLNDLGVEEVDGEIEIVAPAEAGIELLVAGDTVSTAAPDLPFGLKAIARPHRIDTRPKAVRRVVDLIGEAAARLLDDLAPDAASLPPIVSAAVRASVRRALDAGDRPRKALREAPAFVDASGRAWSLRALLDHRLRFSTDEPPYPETARALKADEPAVLRLDAPFAAALRKLAKRGVIDVTRELRLDAEAEARARAPKVPAELPRALADACMTVVTVSDGPVEGQVGILRPSASEGRRIVVHRDGRPVCEVGAPGGWPVVAVIDDATLKTNKRHDGLAPTAQVDAIVGRVRRERDAVLQRRAAAPASAWASVSVARNLQSLDVLGRFWIADDIDAEGVVEVHWAGAVEQEVGLSSVPADVGRATMLRLEARDAVPGWPKALPVSGVVFAAPAAAHARLDAGVRSLLGAVATDALAGMLEAKEGEDSRSLARWRWAAALWGAATKPPPVHDTRGRARNASEVVGELRRRGVVWTSRHAGSADGRFPDQAPAFILLDDGTAPLVDLLESRAPRLLRELGSLAAAPSTTSAASGAPAGDRPRRRRRPASPKPTRTETEVALTEVALTEVALTEDAPDDGGSAPRGWLSRMGELMSGWGRSATQDQLDPSHTLARAVATAAERLGRPAPRLLVASSGRPCTYGRRDDTLVVNLGHAAVAALMERGEVELLAATAIGEVNRLLDCVTDAEERRTTELLIADRAERARKG